MPLDPLAQAFLDQHVAAGSPSMCGLSVEEARQASAEMFAAAPAGEAVAMVQDLRIPGPGGEIPLRVYHPYDEARLPFLVYFHGGGWVVGDLDTQDADCRALANAAECVVVSVDYRLAPENKFPAAAEDAYHATCWVMEHNLDLGGDGAPAAVGGTSAGGNLAAVVALMARDRGGPALACQLLTVPVADYAFATDSYCENGQGYILTSDEMKWFWDHYLSTPEDGENPYASPLRSPDLSALPPALIQTAEFDPLRDEGRVYADRLTAAGVPTIFRCYPGMLHMVLGPEAIADAASFLREYLKVEQDS